MRLFVMVSLLVSACQIADAQSPTYPNKIRGYKVERAAIELSRSTKPSAHRQPKDTDQLIRFGTPRVAHVTPLGITLEIPVIVAPVRQKGRVDFLVFENIVVNGTSVEIDEYHRAFDLPNKRPVTLKEPLRFFVYLPNAVFAAIDQLGGGNNEWPITGVVYVFGRFNKSFFRFKRVIPVQLNLTIRNPLTSA